jgi:hypothetical protein
MARRESTQDQYRKGFAARGRRSQHVKKMEEGRKRQVTGREQHRRRGSKCERRRVNVGWGVQNQQPPGGTKLTATQANDTWMKVLGRYDFYNGSVNTKAALLVAFDTFVAGGIVLKWKDIQDAFGAQKIAVVFVAVFLLVALTASLASLCHTFRSVNPFLGSPTIPKNYHSLLFFSAVNEFTAEGYHAEVAKITDEELLRDLAYQAHALAGGLCGKFAALKKAIWWILFVQIPALAALGLTFLIALLVEILPRIVR